MDKQLVACGCTHRGNVLRIASDGTNGQKAH
jgi:hypothetical protein